jgi:hypothetical protein
MKKHLASRFVNVRSAAVAALVCAAFTSHATVSVNQGTPASGQSSADPLGLPIVGQVMESGSDAAAQQFNQTTLSSALNFVAANLPEGQNNSANPNLLSIDPSKLTLATSVNLQAYFINQGGDYNSTLGFNTTGIGVSSGNPQIIFPNASSQEDFNPNPANTYGARTPSQPLIPGDFVNLGTYAAGTSLDFFLIADGANGGTPVYNSGGAAANPDGFNHVAAFTTSANSPYLFLAFEDLPNGGDQDYNDNVIAINVGAKTIHALLATPEPSMYLTLGGFIALAIWAKRRMDRLEQVRQS